MPYKYKSRAGKYVFGQTSYEPLLDPDNWTDDALDKKVGGLSNLALEKACHHMTNKPRFRTRIGKERLVPIERQLFPGVHGIRSKEVRRNVYQNNNL